MDILLTLFGILFSFIILLKSADELVVIVRKFSRFTKVQGFIVSSVLVSFTTSLPELFVGINSALSSVPTLALGNVVGANIANISLVLGLAGFFGGAVFIKNNPGLQKEFLIAFLCGILPAILFLDRNLSRIDGLILILGYIAYSSGFFHGQFFRQEIKNQKKDKVSVSLWTGFIKEVNSKEGRLNLAKFALTAFVLLFSSNLMVNLISTLAGDIGIPLFLVGLIFLSIGTTLPELAFSYRSIHDHETGLLVGNRLGGIVTNSMLVLGVVALISPFNILHRSAYVFSLTIFALVFFVFWYFTKTEGKIARWEALFLLAIYAVFAFFEMAGFGIFKSF